MKILLFCSAFNGLSRRVWIEFRALRPDVTVHHAPLDQPVERACRAFVLKQKPEQIPARLVAA